MLNPPFSTYALKQGAELLRDYDGFETAATVAALQLLPQNACQLSRLEATVRILAATPPHAHRSAPSQGRLRRLLNSGPFSAELAVNDPIYDDVLCESVGFIGGDYLVASGLASKTPYKVERLLEALFFVQPPVSDALLDDVRPVLGAALELSNRVLTAAGWQRNTLPAGHPTEQVTIPSRELLERLRRAVTLSAEELSLAALDRLLLPHGSCSLDEDPDAVLRRPLLRCGERLVVALPLGLLDAARHAVLEIVHRHGATDDLTRRFRDVVARDVGNSLQAMGMREEDEPPQPSELPAAQRLFRFDDDKLMAVSVVTDDLADYDPTRMHGWWAPRGLGRQLERARQDVEQHVTERYGPVDVMHLLTFESTGAEMYLEAGEPGSSRPLMLSSSELASLAVIEAHEPLALWKFAQAQAAGTPASRFLGAVDRLDLYALYRQHGYTLRLDYRGEDFAAPLQFISAGLMLRAEAKSLRDAHFALFANGTAVEVVRLSEEEPSEPIYRLRQLGLDPRAPVLVEGLPVPVWLFGPDLRRFEPADFEVAANLVRSLAYWLWQLTPDIAALARAAAHPNAVLAIHVDPGPEPSRLHGDEGTLEADMALTRVRAPGELDIQVHPGALVHFRNEDNRGEQLLVGVLLDGLRRMAEGAGGGPVLSESSLAELLRRHFANPREKHLLLLELDTDLRGIGAGLQPYRPVQDADVQHVRAELGEYLREELGLDEGPIAEERRTEVLFRARSRCLAQVEGLVAPLSPDGLLERLVMTNESVAFMRFQQRLKLPTRLACYESEPEAVARLRREMPLLSLTSVACRFLIEYVTAVPPSGAQQVTQAAIDRLTAYAAQLQEIASSLDAIDNGLSDAQYAISAVGTLVQVTPDEYQEGQQRYLDAHVNDERQSAEETFAEHWQHSDDANESDLPTLRREELNRVLPAECGLTADELQALIGALAGLGADIPGEAARRLWPQLRSELAEMLGWEESKVDAGLEFLALLPRGSFYSDADPPAWPRSDVEPWRFYRRLSYNRRPVLVRDTPDGPELLWGFRHLSEAWPLLYSTLIDSRYPAKSRELAELMGALAHRRGKEFEGKVAALYERSDRFKVLAGRDTFGGVRVADENGNPLGDIDVLAAELARRTLWAVDAKDLTGTLTPSELARELKKVFEVGGTKRSKMRRHLARLAWLEAHRTEALADLGLPTEDADGWKVEGMFVTHQPVAAPFVREPALPVLSFRQLRHRLEQAPKPSRPQRPKKRGNKRRRR